MARRALNPLIQQIRESIERYYLALDKREDGDVAQNIAFREIEALLGMRWDQGDVLKRWKGGN